MVFLGLGWGFTTDHVWSDHSKYYSPESQIASERQDQDLNDLIVPAFVATFTSSLLKNLLFPTSQWFQIGEPTSTSTTTPIITIPTPAPGRPITSGCRCGLEGGKRIVGGAEVSQVI